MSLPKMLTLKEASQQSGLTVKLLRRSIARGEMRVVRETPTSKFLIEEAELQSWIVKKRSRPIEDGRPRLVSQR